MPRQRSARSAALGVTTVRRIPTSPMSQRGAGALRRRLVVGGLVLLALVLITISFRSTESGSLSGAQSAGAAVLRPFAVGVDRVAQPFRDAYNWTESLLHARSDAAQLRRENARLRQIAIQNQFAIQENRSLRKQLHYVGSRSFPRDYNAVSAAVIARPDGAFAQSIVVDVGSSRGIHVNDPVVSSDGSLVGLVVRLTGGSARVQLLTDQQAAASAIDVRTRATGIVRHARGTRETLVLDRVRKEDVVHEGDSIVTAGWRANGLGSVYPKGIPIGDVTSVGQTDTDFFQQVQIEPYVDFGALDAVLVLVPKSRTAQ
jgi:rod shape-determining protein MreC